MIMKKRHIFAALAIILLLTPVVLTIGAFVLIPLSLVVLPVLLVFAIFALPALPVWASQPRITGAHWARDAIAVSR